LISVIDTALGKVKDVYAYGTESGNDDLTEGAGACEKIERDSRK